MSIYFAFQAAFFFACSHILIRRGFVASNAMTGSLVSLSMTALTSWILTFFLVPINGLLPQALIYFALAGVFAPGLGRTLGYMGIERIGVARSVPIVNSSPMVASILAVFFVGEEWGLRNFLGTCLVICGIITLSRSHPEKKEFRWSDVLLPVSAAFAFAVSTNLRKVGLQIENIPPMAAAVTASTGVLLALFLIKLQGGWQALKWSKSSLRWFFVAGLCNSTATISVFYALSWGKVVTVEPLVATNPVLSIFLTAIFLKDLEVITRHVTGGALCTVAGTILVVTA
jgi:drug/metabolite transporter, DME family